MSATLVAGIGNVFLGDDGFGVAVAARLSRERLPDHVHVVDVGIRARDLAYRLLDGAYEFAILVDAVARGGAPGTLYVIEPEPAGDAAYAMADGHGAHPEAALAMAQAFGGTSTRVLIVGCEPASIDERMGLSAEVAAAVDEAVALVRRLVESGPDGPPAAEDTGNGDV